MDRPDGTQARPPSVDALARSLAGTGLPHPLLVDAARAALARGDAGSAGDEAERIKAGLLQPVINATGVLLHTNLGRAPLETSQDASYTNLELDLATGRRGSRQDRVGSLLARACGAEAALVVNNGASAVLVVLAALAAGRTTAVSRGELIEIGGGFRIPEIMALSGTRLAEVGTTNRTRVDDYRAVAGEAALLLKVHTSNYRIEGFASSVGVAALAGLGPPVVVDVGSGLLDAACPWLPDGPPGWLASEPAVRQSLEAGAALVTFSGDKLLGGPQAGIVVGRTDLVAACAAHPLYRVTRPGGLVLAALQEVALAYLDRRADRLPLWRMATVPAPELRARADNLVAALDGSRDGSGGAASTERPASTDRPASAGGSAAGASAAASAVVTECRSVAGGGALPGVEIPSWGVSVAGDHRAALRATRPRPIVARVQHDRTLIDLRTVDPADDAVVAAALAAVRT
jgi:L-seryl-tRNA(Ser) seleniumtransferase